MPKEERGRSGIAFSVSCPAEGVGGSQQNRSMATHQLTTRDHMTLQFEELHWRFAGAKEAAIRDQFGESASRYYQRLAALIDTQEALAAYPMTVRRLQRLRDSRRAVRVTRSA